MMSAITDGPDRGGRAFSAEFDLSEVGDPLDPALALRPVALLDWEYKVGHRENERCRRPGLGGGLVRALGGNSANVRF